MPKDAKARGYGLYYFVRDFIVSFAAFLGGFIWKISPAFNLFTAAAFGVVGTVIFIFYGKEQASKISVTMAPME